MYRRCRETCSSLLPFGQTGCFLNRLLTCIPGLWLLLFLPLINSMSWKCLETLEFCSRTCLVPSRSLRTVCPLEWTGGLGAECRILQGPSREGRESPSLARVHGGGGGGGGALCPGCFGSTDSRLYPAASSLPAPPPAREGPVGTEELAEGGSRLPWDSFQAPRRLSPLVTSLCSELCMSSTSLSREKSGRGSLC